MTFQNYHHRRTRRAGAGGGGGLQPPIIFQKAIFGQKKLCNIRAKPLDFRASNGIFGQLNLKPPKQNWSRRTPMVIIKPFMICIYGIIILLAMAWQSMSSTY